MKSHTGFATVITAFIAFAVPAHAQEGEGFPPADEGGEVGATDPVSEPAPAETTTTAATAAAGYKKGFFVNSDDGEFALTINGRVQGRYTFEGIDGGDDESNFSIARARFGFKGHAFGEDVKYKFQADLGKGNVVLKDFYIDYKTGGTMIVRAGQWKRPFSRQQITSSGNLELVDRAITDKAFGAGRDIGVAVHNNYEKSPDIEWAVGVFNATGDKPRFSGDADPMTGEVSGSFSNVPDMFGPAIVARAGYNSPDLKGYSEADFEGGPLRYGAAASVLVELDMDDNNDSGVLGEVDFIVKNNGLSASGGVYFGTAQNDMDFVDQGFAALGFHAQAGYMLSDNLQPAVRFALVSFDDDAATDLMEATGGVSYYIHKHGLKWQTDAGLLRGTVGGASSNNVLVRSQLQLAF